MEYNTWTHKSNNYSVQDQPVQENFMTGDVLYGGIKAREVWYRGKRIWNGNMTFWRWAKSSPLGGYVFANVERYNVYKQSQTYKTYFPPSSATVSSEEYLHTNYEEYFDFHDAREGSTIYPPTIRVSGSGEYITAYTGSSVDEQGRYNFAFEITGDQREKEQIAILETGWSYKGYVYQTKFPCAMLQTGYVLLPPGEYTVYSNLSAIARQSRQGPADQSDYDFRFVKIEGDGLELKYCESYIYDQMGYTDIAHDEGFTTPWYTFILTEPKALKIVAEIGANNSATITWRPYFSRSNSYYTGVRAGQLRGYINTEQDFSGQRFTYIVNDKRISKDGIEYNLDPTLCLDPETLEYVEVVQRIPVQDRHYALNAVNSSDWYGVYFTDDKIIIYKNGDTENPFFLYYEQGFAYYGIESEGGN